MLEIISGSSQASFSTFPIEHWVYFTYLPKALEKLAHNLFNIQYFCSFYFTADYLQFYFAFIFCRYANVGHTISLDTHACKKICKLFLHLMIPFDMEKN